MRRFLRAGPVGSALLAFAEPSSARGYPRALPHKLLACLPGLLFHWNHATAVEVEARGQTTMAGSVIQGAAFLLFVVGVLIYAVILYNELVRLRNDNDRAWANIDVLLKQRHDEIPNLVETVKGYMQHEEQTLLAVTQARAA